MKQIRISKFLSSLHLTQGQRELVKFLRNYTLMSKVPKRDKQVPAHLKTSIASEAGDKRDTGAFDEILQVKPE